MTEVFGVPIQALFGQLMLGLVNGSFYAMLSLGLAVIFGLLGVVNFAHGAMYMLGAYVAWWGMDGVDLTHIAIGSTVLDLGIKFQFNFWVALIVGPLFVGLLGVVVERLLLRRLYKLDPLYGLLLTFGLALVVQGMFSQFYGSSGQSYDTPEALSGATNLGFMILPNYRGFVIAASLVVCFGTWLLIERTQLGARLRAGTENPALVQAFGVNVPLMVTLTYAGGAALAGLAGVLAAPVIQVTPLMGSNLIIVVFAVVVIGGMGSIIGSIVTGLVLGLLEGLTRVFYPEASNVVVFFIMAVVLMIRPAGLFGREK